jgi:hypothetical protein
MTAPDEATGPWSRPPAELAARVRSPVEVATGHLGSIDVADDPGIQAAPAV